MFNRHILTRKKESISIIKSTAIIKQRHWLNNKVKELLQQNQKPPNKQSIWSNKSLRIHIKILMIMKNLINLSRKPKNWIKTVKKRRNKVKLINLIKKTNKK